MTRPPAAAPGTSTAISARQCRNVPATTFIGRPSLTVPGGASCQSLIFSPDNLRKHRCPNCQLTQSFPLSNWVYIVVCVWVVDMALIQDIHQHQWSYFDRIYRETCLTTEKACRPPSVYATRIGPAIRCCAPARAWRGTSGQITMFNTPDKKSLSQNYSSHKTQPLASDLLRLPNR